MQDSLLLTQLITLVSSIQIAGFGGLFALFGTQMLVIDVEGNLKCAHLLALLFAGEQYLYEVHSHAPEMHLTHQLAGSSYARSDIWTLGCVLFRLLYGHNLFPEKDPIKEKLKLRDSA